LHMHVFIYVCAYTHMHMHVHVRMPHVCIHVRMCVYTYVSTRWCNFDVVASSNFNVWYADSGKADNMTIITSYVWWRNPVKISRPRIQSNNLI